MPTVSCLHIWPKVGEIEAWSSILELLPQLWRRTTPSPPSPCTLLPPTFEPLPLLGSQMQAVIEVKKQKWKVVLASLTYNYCGLNSYNNKITPLCFYLNLSVGEICDKILQGSDACCVYVCHGYKLYINSISSYFTLNQLKKFSICVKRKRFLTWQIDDKKLYWNWVNFLDYLLSFIFYPPQDPGID